MFLNPTQFKAVNLTTLNKLFKMKKFSVIVTTLGAFSLTACQSTPSVPVMQRADSTYETTGIGTTKIKAQTQALENAKQTCGRFQPIVISNEVHYNGVLDERSGRMIEQVGSIAGAVLGAKMPDLSREDDYEYTISFRCK